jgi:hypothetical protein
MLEVVKGWLRQGNLGLLRSALQGGFIGLIGLVKSWFKGGGGVHCTPRICMSSWRLLAALDSLTGNKTEQGAEMRLGWPLGSNAGILGVEAKT